MNDESDNTRIIDGKKLLNDETPRIVDTEETSVPIMPRRIHRKPNKSDNALWITIVVAIAVVVALACLYFFLIKSPSNVDNEGRHSDDEDFGNFGRMVNTIDDNIDNAESNRATIMPREEYAVEGDSLMVSVSETDFIDGNTGHLYEEPVPTEVRPVSEYGTDDISKSSQTHEVVEVAPVETESNELFDAVEQMPQFPGGETAMYSWLSSHIYYPDLAREDGIQGRVVVKFVVEKDGSITNVQVARGVHYTLDSEAVRLVKAMPRWNPGRNKGRVVRVYYYLPVTFRLQ